MAKVSVVIPVFNSALYLEECIASLLSQSLFDCEFIFVNDGSTDGSLTILERFQAKDTRIQIINQLNQGVSVARNMGLHYAQGDYVGFVDSDDVVAADYYHTLYEAACQHDATIVSSNFVALQDGVSVVAKNYFPTAVPLDSAYIAEKILPFFIQQDDLNSCCTKLFKRSMLVSHAIIFPVGMTHGEDFMFALKSYTKASSVVFLDYSGYFYKEVSASATRNILVTDLFQQALGLYRYDYRTSLDLGLEDETIAKLKSIRFISTVVSLVQIYFKKNEVVSFVQRYLYVKKMIANSEVQMALSCYWDVLIFGKSKYHLFLLKAIKRQFMLGLVMATQYSNYRNTI